MNAEIVALDVSRRFSGGHFFLQIRKELDKIGVEGLNAVNLIRDRKTGKMNICNSFSWSTYFVVFLFTFYGVN